jgi:hypothetical protein
MNKRGDVVKVTRDGFNVWIPRTPEEMQALRDRDAAAGRWHDDGGEPILYGPYNGFPQDVNELEVTVTLTRKVEWTHWGNKPKFLLEGTATIDGVKRVVKFKQRKV